jgi:hypothetical protein
MEGGMGTSTLLGIAAIVAIVAFVVFAFRQGQGVKRRPQGTPPDNTGGYTS